MATLAGSTIASTYPLLLKIDSNGIDGTLRAIEDGDGTDSAVKISTGAMSVDGNVTITTTDNSDNLTLTSTDDDANVGPNLVLFRDTNDSAAVNDYIGKITFRGEDVDENNIDYVTLNSQITNATSEEGKFWIGTFVGGTERQRISIAGAETIFNEDAQDLNLRVEGSSNANLLFVDAGNNRVGIGTNAPTSTFDVRASSGAKLLYEDSGEGLLSLISSGSTAVVRLDARSGEHHYLTNGGALGIGTASPNIGSYNTERGVLTISSTDNGSANNYANLELQGHAIANNVSVGDISWYDHTNQNAIVRGGRDSSTTTGFLSFFTNGGSGVGERMRILSGGGLTFNGDTAAANALDDYEEGTINPTLLGASSNPTQIYNARGGFYTKIGNRVFYTIRIQMNGSGISAGSGAVTIGGLPFTVHNDVNNRGACTVGFGTSWNTGQHGCPTHGFHDGGTATASLWVYDNDGGNIGESEQADAADITNSTQIVVSGHYITHT